LLVALDTTGVGVHSPARISPTRNVRADDSTSVMKVKRRKGISAFFGAATGPAGSVERYFRARPLPAQAAVNVASKA